MANEKHLERLRNEKKERFKWSKDPTNIFLRDLTYADLSHEDLSYADLRSANLTGANLTSADLTGVDMRTAILRNANLSRAILNGADLRASNFFNADFSDAKLELANLNGANLNGASLTGADLRLASFYGAELASANFANSYFGATILGEVDLSETLGLAEVIHCSPSTLGVDTIYKSKGRISEIFLRGVGVAESLIGQIHSLVGAEDGIQFYSCFISYSHRDEEFARRLYGRMRDAHLRVWYAPEEMKSGEKLHEQIETAIHVFDKLLIVLSEASLRSEWVMTELRKAFKAERRSGKRKLFPVRLVDFEMLRDWECFDADGGKDLAVELREYFIPDFSNWKDHDAFEAAFSRLLKDLKANTPSA